MLRDHDARINNTVQGFSSPLLPRWSSISSIQHKPVILSWALLVPLGTRRFCSPGEKVCNRMVLELAFRRLGISCAGHSPAVEIPVASQECFVRVTVTVEKTPPILVAFAAAVVLSLDLKYGMALRVR